MQTYQGAVLSPLLFLLYVNDATSAPVDASVNLFADDTPSSCVTSVLIALSSVCKLLWMT